MKKVGQYILYIFIAVSICTGLFFTQKKLTIQREKSWSQERMSYLPQSEKIKPFLLGFSSTYANYLWIKTMIYFGDHYMGDREYTYLVTMTDMVTKLNPYYFPAYEFAGIMLPGYGDNIEAARILLNRGISRIGNKKFNLFFYLGWLYYDQYEDYEQAAYFIGLAAKGKNAPIHLSGLSARLYTQIDKKDMALELLHSVYNTTENPAVKKAVEKKIKLIAKF